MRKDKFREAAEKICAKILDHNMFGDDKEYRFAVEFITQIILDVVRLDRKEQESVVKNCKFSNNTE
jgi:hypothetical protein